MTTATETQPSRRVKLMGRRSGILFHPTSLPGPFGIGDLGPTAHEFVDVLAAMGQRIWQILPLSPTSYGDSPYFSPSAFAGNPFLVSPERLFEAGYLDRADLVPVPGDPAHIDFGAVSAHKAAILDKAFRTFRSEGGSARAEGLPYSEFTREHADWLEEYALFAAIKEEHGGRPWHEWEPALAGRDPAALDRARVRLADRLAFHRFVQWQFSVQWADLKARANARGIAMVGDAPIFVAHDSADVWAHPDLFRLRADHQPAVVAGVPPDYFSATGQLWGNPHYAWERMAQTGYAWWIARLRHLLRLVDQIRIDHFRGFAAFWEIPFGEPTAVNGRWVEGPGAALFEAIRAELGDALPLIAEDLGVLTPDVVALRDRFGLPGMKILQFAFDSKEENEYLPHTYGRNSVVYPGTHDNDTIMGWYAKAAPEDRAWFEEYAGRLGELREPSWEMIRLGHASVSDTSIVAMQDLLGLGSEARMNTPGKLGGNWAWRLRQGELGESVARRFARLTRVYGR